MREETAGVQELLPCMRLQQSRLFLRPAEGAETHMVIAIKPTEGAGAFRPLKSSSQDNRL